MIISSESDIKFHTGFHSLITACQAHQKENSCDEMLMDIKMENECKQIISDCESLFGTLLDVYNNDINARDEKGKLNNYCWISTIFN